MCAVILFCKIGWHWFHKVFPSVRFPEDVEDDSTTFHPEYSHQIYGDEWVLCPHPDSALLIMKRFSIHLLPVLQLIISYFHFFFFLVCYPVSTRMPQVLHYHSAAPSVTLQTHTVNNCFVDDGGKFLLRYAKTKRFAWTPVCLACGIDLAEMLLRVIFERDCFSLHYWQWHLCQLSLRSKLRFQIIQY